MPKFDVAWRSADGADTWRVTDLVVISPDRSDIRTKSIRAKRYAEGEATRIAQLEKAAHYRHRIRNFDRIRARILIAAFDVYGRLGDELNRFIRDVAETAYPQGDTDGLKSGWTSRARQLLSVALQRGNADALSWFCSTAWPPDLHAPDDPEQDERHPEQPHQPPLPPLPPPPLQPPPPSGAASAAAAVPAAGPPA